MHLERSLAVFLLLLPACQPSNPNAIQNTDITPPTIVWMTGPADGSVVPWSDFCFPSFAKDETSDTDSIQIRYSFREWSPGIKGERHFAEWRPQKSFPPCFEGVKDGFYEFNVQFRDASGNITSEKRTFQVDTSHGDSPLKDY